MTRKKDGRFPKGQSGNPGGRPKAAHDMQELARAHSTEALNTLVSIMQNGKAAERIQAAKIIIERGWGKPLQPAEITGKGEQTVIHVRIGEKEIPPPAPQLSE